MNRNDPTQKGKRKNDRTYYTDHAVRRRPCFRAETVFICMYVCMYTRMCVRPGAREAIDGFSSVWRAAVMAAAAAVGRRHGNILSGRSRSFGGVRVKCTKSFFKKKKSVFTDVCYSVRVFPSLVLFTGYLAKVPAGIEFESRIWASLPNWGPFGLSAGIKLKWSIIVRLYFSAILYCVLIILHFLCFLLFCFIFAIRSASF